MILTRGGFRFRLSLSVYKLVSEQGRVGRVVRVVVAQLPRHTPCHAHRGGGAALGGGGRGVWGPWL